MKTKRFNQLGIILFIFIGIISCRKNLTPPEDTPPPIGVNRTLTEISFTPSGNPTNNSVYISQISANDDEIILSLNVRGVTNVHGAAIEINFDENRISFISASEGAFLDQGGGTNTIFTYGLEEGNNGILLLGINRLGTGVGVNGDGTLGTIVLKALTNQTNTPINFNITNSALKLPSNGGNIGRIGWIGGSLSYQ